jgi:hypothetical protein
MQLDRTSDHLMALAKVEANAMRPGYRLRIRAQYAFIKACELSR